MDAPPLVQLTDPNGDGVYTASQETIPGDYNARIIQGTGTKSCGEFGGTCPGEPTYTIEDFGKVILEEDETFSASVSFDGNGGSGGGFFDNVTNGVRGLLPNTGGVTLAVLSVGALLVAGGLLIRRISR